MKATDTMKEGKERAKEAIEHSVAAQKTALDYTAKQAKAAFETAKQQLGYAGTPAGTAAESIERGMDIVLEAQKELLDLVAEPVLHSTGEIESGTNGIAVALRIVRRQRHSFAPFRYMLCVQESRGLNMASEKKRQPPIHSKPFAG